MGIHTTQCHTVPLQTTPKAALSGCETNTLQMQLSWSSHVLLRRLAKERRRRLEKETVCKYTRYTSRCTTTWSWLGTPNINTHNPFSFKPITDSWTNPHLLYTCCQSCVSNAGRISESLQSPSLPTCRLATGVLGFRGFFVGLVFFSSPATFSLTWSSKQACYRISWCFSSLKLYKRGKSL